MRQPRFGATVLWSAIAAAFIGPGTVTTAASAGASFGAALLWAVLFSLIATYVLQEAAARLAIASGKDLGAILQARYPNGLGRAITVIVAGGAILIGAIAYEAGNILGGVAGAMLAIDVPRWVVTLAVGVAAGLLLALGSPAKIARLLAVLVAVMGGGFLAVAISLAPPLGEVLRGLTVPSMPDGSGLLIVALIGTTVVPYNLFLGASLAKDRPLAETRFGLAVAIGIGGLVTAAIVVVGSALSGEFSFDALAALLAERLGNWATTGLALGLLAAGLSSAVTAPLAAAITARGLFGDDSDRWVATGWRFRAVWLLVLACGIGFGLADIRPVPAIVVAQALNGILLPAIAVFLLLATRDRALLGGNANGALGNMALLLVTAVVTLLGAVSLWRVFETLTG